MFADETSFASCLQENNALAGLYQRPLIDAARAVVEGSYSVAPLVLPSQRPVHGSAGMPHLSHTYSSIRQLALMAKQLHSCRPAYELAMPTAALQQLQLPFRHGAY